MHNSGVLYAALLSHACVGISVINHRNREFSRIVSRAFFQIDLPTGS